MALRITGADLSNATNAPAPATPYDPIKNPLLDADTRAMIDKWPKGLATNGLYCAVQFVRRGGVKGSDPICYVNVVNTTTNYFRSFLNLSPEYLIQEELFDSGGKPVEKTATGRLSRTSVSQIQEYYRENAHVRFRSKHMLVWPISYAQIGGVSIPATFQLTHPGVYTLHVRMQLVDGKWDESKNLHLRPTWLPEVVAKVQIRPEDITTSSQSPSGETNLLPK